MVKRILNCVKKFAIIAFEVFKMKKLKIYFTSDMHGFVYPTDYTNNEKKPIGMLNVINSFTKDENT